MNHDLQPALATRGWLVTRSGETELNDGRYVLGRHPEAQIRVDDLSVSRRHVGITVSGEVVTIEDLGSRNGTWVNNARLEGPRQLQDGDEVRVGNTRWRFRRNLANEPTQAILPAEDAHPGGASPPSSGIEDADEEVI